MMSACDISIIVVSYNVRALLEECLRSIERQRGVRYEVFVVDNASSDGSAALVREQFPWVHLTASAENLGFARANNRVLPEAGGGLIYYLNPDTVLPDGALAEICAFMRRHPEIGVASTGLVFPDGRDQPAVKRRHDGARYARRELQGLPGDIAWVLGASMVARRDLMLRTGGFDERFFIYGEDEDLCLSVRKLGFEVGFIGQVKVTHYQGQSEKATPRPELVRKKLLGSLVFYEKHYGEATRRRIARAARRGAAWQMVRAVMHPGYWLRRGAAHGRYERARLEWETFGGWRGGQAG